MGTWLGRALAGPTPVQGISLRVKAHVVVLAVASWLVGTMAVE
jgi:hypothetical protein